MDLFSGLMSSVYGDGYGMCKLLSGKAFLCPEGGVSFRNEEREQVLSLLQWVHYPLYMVDPLATGVDLASSFQGIATPQGSEEPCTVVFFTEHRCGSPLSFPHSGCPPGQGLPPAVSAL